MTEIPAGMLYTTARAEVREEDKFMLAPRIQYKGTVNLIAYEPALPTGWSGETHAQAPTRPVEFLDHDERKQRGFDGRDYDQGQ